MLNALPLDSDILERCYKFAHEAISKLVDGPQRDFFLANYPPYINGFFYCVDLTESDTPILVPSNEGKQ